MKVKEMIQAIGSDVSTSNSKMPGAAYGISTASCNTGGKLREVEGSVCYKCYACKFEKMRPSVHMGYTKRMNATLEATRDLIKRGEWIEAITARIVTKCAKTVPFMRWHDSGDLLNFEHLLNIVEVCKRTPDIQHWIPTKEKAIVKRYLRERGRFPSNLAVRVSGAMVDGTAPNMPLTSTVHKDGESLGHECPAYKQGGQCGECRACWSQDVANVSYPLH